MDIKFGDVLYSWIDYLGVTVDRVAKLAGLQPHYLSATKRDPPGGIRKPTERNQKRIYSALENIWGKPMTRDRFLQGPPVRVSTRSKGVHLSAKNMEHVLSNKPDGDLLKNEDNHTIVSSPIRNPKKARK